MLGRSMTASAGGKIKEDGYGISVWIRSVNHRYFNCNICLPKGLQFLESEVRNLIHSQLQRGKIDVQVEIDMFPEHLRKLELDRELADKLLQAAGEFADAKGIELGFTAEKVFSYPDVVRYTTKIDEDDQIRKNCLKAVKVALANHVRERVCEGDKLTEALREINSRVKTGTEKINSLCAAQSNTIRQRLEAVNEALPGSGNMDPVRIAQEMALLISKSDITEEITRLQSHIQRFRKLLSEDMMIGKKGEFLIQEMHREVNTIGSKSMITAISDLVVDLKVDIEKMREQIQNLE